MFFLFLFTYGAAKISNKSLSFYSFSTKKGKNAKKSRQLAPSALVKKLYEKKIYFLLFLPALLAHEVGGAEAHEDGDAAAQRSVYVVVGAVIL